MQDELVILKTMIFLLLAHAIDAEVNTAFYR